MHMLQAYVAEAPDDKEKDELPALFFVSLAVIAVSIVFLYACKEISTWAPAASQYCI